MLSRRNAKAKIDSLLSQINDPKNSNLTLRAQCLAKFRIWARGTNPDFTEASEEVEVGALIDAQMSLDLTNLCRILAERPVAI